MYYVNNKIILVIYNKLNYNNITLPLLTQANE